MTSLTTETNVVSGQKTGWSLLRKLGEGDAGEVYLVESLLEHCIGILKRPVRSVFIGEIRRQAEQIRTEGRILQALAEILPPPTNPSIRAPHLLDESKPGSEFSERYFIVIERASGFDLATLARTARLGLDENRENPLDPLEIVFLQHIARHGQVPPRLLLAALDAVLTTLTLIHHTAVDGASGILWNDIKPDHLFWDPSTASMMMIDWGNARFLEESGFSRDMRYTAAGDYRQFLDEMGHFLQQVAPDLYASLAWPEPGHLYEDITPLIESLQERLQASLAQATRLVKDARVHEMELLTPNLETGLDLSGLGQIHEQILTLGELPDYPAALRQASRVAANLAVAGDMGAIRDLSQWAVELPGASHEALKLLADLAHLAATTPGSAYTPLAEAVKSAANQDWPETLWGLLKALENTPEPDWWNDLLTPVRRLASDDATASIRPLLQLRRIHLTLQTRRQNLEDLASREPSQEIESEIEHLQAVLEAVQEVIYRWVQPEPPPPYSTLVYQDVEELVNEIETLLPGSGSRLWKELEPARSCVHEVMEAWGRKEFVNARRLLRQVLLFDPDRRRLLRADQAIAAAPGWLQRIHAGPQPGEKLLDVVTNLEFEGRELHNQVGPAGWLDGTLDALKVIRRGMWPGDLLRQQPVLLTELPWLAQFERAEILHQLLRSNSISLNHLPSIQEVRETRFGPESEISLIEPLDAWIPEARGSSARVYLGQYRAGNGEQREAAIKLMRRDKSEYALPLFREEAQILRIMQDVPGVSRMVECGFLWMGDSPELPSDHDLSAIQAMRGEALRIPPDAVSQFLDLLEPRVKEGWTPYLLIERQRREENLLLMCDASLNRGKFLPVPQLLFMSIQICDLLSIAHQRNIVYRDHKILHYYWQKENNGISVIDWNVARYHPEGLSPLDIHMDLVQFGARGLHHILTGRTAPGALPLGPTRPEEIEQAEQSYQAQWTYDDQRLTFQIRTILEQLLSGAYTSASDLRDDLKRAYLEDH